MAEMHGNGADLLFSSRLISGLRSLRGVSWQELVDRLANLDHLEQERLAFVLLMVHLSGCVTCQADSYKAMRGCALCSQQTLKRFRGSDQMLMEKFAESKVVINQYLREVRKDNESVE